MGRRLLDGESIVAECAGVVLTNVRVWRELAGTGRYALTSIMVDEVQWAGVRRVHRPMLLVIAAFFGVVGLAGYAVGKSEVALLGGLVLATVAIVYYFLTRHVALQVAGSTGLIASAIRGGEAERDRALAFVADVEKRAIAARGAG
ncbi:MAG: hypothetical protein HYV09_04155 [Deltaproteobacteria bacterium]|nr:hypothetical protein [Deltaproteobacteria bacterium]